MNLAFSYLTDLLFCETTRVAEAAVVGSAPSITYKFTGSNTIGSYRNLSTVDAPAYSCGSLSAIRAFASDIAYIMSEDAYFGTVNSKFLKATTLGTNIPAVLLHGTLGVNVGGIYPAIGNFGGTPHILSYDPDIKRAGFWVTNQNLGSLTAVGSLSVTLGTYMASLETDGLTMYAMLPQGVYDFDTSPNIIVDTSRAEDLNCRQVIFRDELYFKNKQSVIKYTTPPQSVGYDLGDGLPSDKLGEITAWCASWRWLFASVKGATYSHILAYDGKGWQNYARIPTAGLWVREMFLNSNPDAIDRLWCIFGNYAYPGYFLNPMVNPLNAATYSYVPTGYFTLPMFDGGMAEELGAFYDENIIADGIVGSNRITCLYGLDGANPVTTLGVVATNTQALILGSPYGLEGYKIQPKFILSSATSGSTPIYQEAIIHYLKLPEDRESFEFTIDLKETAIKETRPLEAVIGSLNYERQKRTLMPFWYGIIPTKNVKVLEAPSAENIQEDKIFQGEREGLVTIRVAEIL